MASSREGRERRVAASPATDEGSRLSTPDPDPPAASASRREPRTCVRSATGGTPRSAPSALGVCLPVLQLLRSRRAVPGVRPSPSGGQRRVRGTSDGGATSRQVVSNSAIDSSRTSNRSIDSVSSSMVCPLPLRPRRSCVAAMAAPARRDGAGSRDGRQPGRESQRSGGWHRPLKPWRPGATRFRSRPWTPIRPVTMIRAGS